VTTTTEGRLTRRELIVGAALAVAAMALTAWLARDLWFTSDEWEFLANRSAFDLGDLTRPIGGHWATWSVLLLRGLYEVGGVDFWPWFYVPRLLGHTALAAGIWWVLRRRGTDPLIALVTFAVLLVLGVSGYQRALQVGNWVVYAALLYVAWVVNRNEKPSTREKVLVSAVLLVAVLGNGYSLAVIGGLGLALLVTRRLVPWIPSLVPPVAVYGAWMLRYGDTFKEGPPLGERLLGVPADAFRVLRTAFDVTTGLPNALAAVLVVAVVAWLVLLAVRRQLDPFDLVVLATLAVGLFLLAFQRVAIDPDAAGRDRYGYSVIVLLLMVLPTHLPRLHARWEQGVALGVGALLVVANVASLKDAIDVRARPSQEARAVIEAAAQLIVAGEVVVDRTSPLAPGLSVQELEQLIRDGYRPTGTPDEAALEEARGALRISVLPPNRVRGQPQRVAAEPTTALDDDGCLAVADGEDDSVDVTTRGLLRFDRPADQTVTITWEDESGIGRRVLEDDEDAGPTAVQLVGPPRRAATVRFATEGGDLLVCGFTDD
jgi:hypothetical protein